MKEVPSPKPKKLTKALQDLALANPAGIAAKIGRGYADLQARVPYADDDLIISLGNMLKLHEHSAKQGQSLLGKLVALFGYSFADPDAIEIDGMRLTQLYSLAEEVPSTEVLIGKSYMLNIRKFRSLLKTAAENKRPPTDNPEGTPPAAGPPPAS